MNDSAVGWCYRLKLFLEHFSIKAAVLNSQLPIQSRQHIVEQFNKGVFDYVIASDEVPIYHKIKDCTYPSSGGRVTFGRVYRCRRNRGLAVP